MFGHQQNKQMAELEQEPSCSIISQLAVSHIKLARLSLLLEFKYTQPKIMSVMLSRQRIKIH
jgi:hypothetical protein